MKFSLFFQYQGIAKAFLCFLYWTFLFFLTNPVLHCQENAVFSGDAGSFPGELTAFMGPNIDENQEKIIGLFESNWNEGLFDSEEKSNIIKISDLLAGQNARPVPHFINLIRLLNLFIEEDPGRKHFPKWIEATKYYAADNGYRLSFIDELLVQIYLLLKDNIIFRSSAVQWKAANGGFNLHFDSTLYVSFDRADLTCYSSNDSIVIYNTRGTLSLSEKRWNGTGGRVGWERSGYELHEVSADLKNYTINLNNNNYSADSVTFTHGEYFSEKITGKLTDRVVRRTESTNTTYPRFTSYSQNISITNVFPDVNYKGGISMRGKSLIGAGSEDSDANITIMLNGERFFTGFSDYFIFSQEEISSNSTEITIFIEEDSIYHPDQRLNFSGKNSVLTLNRNDNAMSESPFSNSYHEVNMNFGQLIWEKNEDRIYFTMPSGRSAGTANFESFSYFSNERFMEIQGRDEVHPLLSVRRYASANEGAELTAEGYASFMRRPVSSIRHQLISLAIEGFIYYYSGSGIFTVNEKLNDYLLSSRNLIDYDVINFESRTNAPQEHGVLDLNTFELKINGIPQAFISNVQNVNIYPENNSVILTQNRNFRFGGRVNAGYLTFYGDNFSFDYDNFSINLQKIDSISIVAARDEYDMYGRALVENVKNLIRNVTGKIHVDKPDNKSGNEDYEEFPKFQSIDHSYVFYDSPDIHDGVYEQKNIYFRVYPFKIDSLNTFRFEYVNLEGVFVTSGIFPEFEENLSLQEDMSLGFTHVTTDAGMLLYEGKGRFYDMIKMSREGLEGDGIIEYLTSSIYSEDINFFPDSANIFANEFRMEKSSDAGGFPKVSSRDNFVQWLPLKDELYIEKGERPFTLLNDNTTLAGNLLLTPEKLKGDGKLETENSLFASSLFRFGPNSFESDTADFILYDTGGEEIVFESPDVYANVDTERLTGEFRVNDGQKGVMFPKNLYAAYPENFSWDIGSGEMKLLSSETVPGEEYSGALFISVCGERDSLYYISPSTTFGYRDNILTSDGVRSIGVADATIIPYGERIKVEKDGAMSELQGAMVETGAGHTIYDAGIRVYSKNRYGGYGYYDYVDDRNNVHPFRFDTIGVNSDTTTFASGTIGEEENFRLNDYLIFRGNVFLEAGNKLLTFEGGAGLIKTCPEQDPEWIYFSNEINPLNVMIPVPGEPVSTGDEDIHAGLLLSGHTPEIYPAFFVRKKNNSDINLIAADGYLQYHTATNSYRLGPQEKFNNPEYPGNFVRLGTDNCILYGEGVIDPGAELGQLKLNSAGFFTSSAEKEETKLELALGVDFFFSDDAIEIMSGEFLTGEEGGQIDSMGFFHTKGLNHLLGKEAAGEYRQQRTRGSSGRRIPGPMDKTLFFSKVEFIWDNESGSYRSVGKLDLKYIGGVKINRQVTGYIEISKRSTGDFFDLYIEAGEGKWYYFGYTRGNMQAYSSNGAFVETINDLRTRRREMRVPQGETPYIYMPATETKLNQFFSRYRRNSEAGDEAGKDVYNGGRENK